MPPLSLNFNTLVMLLCLTAVSRMSKSKFDPCLSELPDLGSISSVYPLTFRPVICAIVSGNGQVG